MLSPSITEQTALSQIGSDLESISEKNVYNRCLKIGQSFKRRSNAVNTATDIDYAKQVAIFQPIAEQLFRDLLADGRNNYLGYRISNDSDLMRCYETDIIHAVKILKIPMDFPFYSDKKTEKTFSDVMSLVLQRANAFFGNSSISINPPEYIQVLMDLANIDLESSAEMKIQSHSLLQTLFRKAYHIWQVNSQYEYLTNEESVKLLWANAIHSLRDGKYASYLSWTQIKNILSVIEGEIQRGKYSLDEVSAKMLFQVYAANFPKQNEFPSSLLVEMRKFLPSFEEESHGSTFEKRLEGEFKLVTQKMQESYPYIAWNSCLRFDNPIMHFGMETDILFRHKKTGIIVACQIDGKKYHSFPAFNKKALKENQKTKSRNFGFDQAGCPRFEISDSEGNYAVRITSFLRNMVVLPVHQKLQQDYLQSLMESEKELRERQERLKKDNEKITCQIPVIAENFSLQLDRHAKLNSRFVELTKFCDGFDGYENDFEFISSNLFDIQLKATKAKEMLSQKKAQLESNVKAIEKLNVDFNKLQNLIDDFTPYTRSLGEEFAVLEKKLVLASKEAEPLFVIKEEKQRALNNAYKKSDEIDAKIKLKQTRLLEIKKALAKFQDNSQGMPDSNDCKLVGQLCGDTEETASLKKYRTRIQRLWEKEKPTVALKVSELEDEIATLRKQQDVSTYRKAADIADENYREAIKKEENLRAMVSKLESELRAEYPGIEIIKQFKSAKEKLAKKIAEHEENAVSLTKEMELLSMLEEDLEQVESKLQEIETEHSKRIEKLRAQLLLEAHSVQEKASSVEYSSYAIICLTQDNHAAIKKARSFKDFEELKSKLKFANEMISKTENDIKLRKIRLSDSLAGFDCEESLILQKKIASCKKLSEVNLLEKEIPEFKERWLKQQQELQEQQEQELLEQQQEKEEGQGQGQGQEQLGQKNEMPVQQNFIPVQSRTYAPGYQSTSVVTSQHNHMHMPSQQVAMPLQHGPMPSHPIPMPYNGYFFVYDPRYGTVPMIYGGHAPQHVPYVQPQPHHPQQYPQAPYGKSRNGQGPFG